jgi:hypothetical protein
VFRAALRLARPAALTLVTVIATACVGSAGAAAPTPSATPDPDKVIFRVSWDGGFVSPQMLLGRLPIVAVYADGRVITQGPQIEIFPGPLMPNLVEHTLSGTALERLIELASDKDLLRNANYDFPGIADAPDTVLEINLDGTSYRISAYALLEAAIEADIEAGETQLDGATVEGRAALREFIDALTGIPAADFVDEEHPYEYGALRLFWSKAEIARDSEFPGEQPPVAWPLGDLATAGETVDNPAIDVRCQVLEGDDLAKVFLLLAEANTLSVFESGDAFYTFIPRPLLHGETGC